MNRFATSPLPALALGALLVAALSAVMISEYGVDVALGVAARFLHVAGAIVWGGMIVFVNVVQLAALAAASDAERPVIVRRIVPGSTRLFTIAADVTLATGLAMTWPVHQSLPHRPMLMLGILGGIAMWAIVRVVLRPAIARITGEVAATDAEKAAARARVALYARVNLALLLPVTLAMLVASHAGG
ncbi:MAG: hypothetical protein ACK4MF_05005 [Hyphomicrobiaceae bacterium]